MKKLYIGITIGIIISLLINSMLIEIEINNVKKQLLSTKEELSRGMKYIQDSRFLLSFPVNVTAYSPSIDETDSTPFVTASNEIVKVGGCAISRDIENILGLKFGDYIVLNNVGTFEFTDRMAPRFEKQVDVFKPTKKQAKQFGKMENIEMTVIRRG